MTQHSVSDNNKYVLLDSKYFPRKVIVRQGPGKSQRGQVKEGFTILIWRSHIFGPQPGISDLG